MGETNNTASPSKSLIFVRRLASTVILWVAVLWSLLSTNREIADWLLLAMLVSAVALGLREFSTLLRKKTFAHYPNLMVWGGAAFVALLGLIASNRISTGLPVEANEVALFGIFIFAICCVRFLDKSGASGIIAMATTLLGFTYVAVLMSFLVKLFYFPGINGDWFVLFFVVVTKFSDAGAYATGSLIGRHKMIPRISPGKTWEGFGGAIVISTGLGLALKYFAGDKLGEMTWLHAIILGVVLSGLAVVGDLIESLFKREAGVKDSGNLFPGIGGALDLLDSILFNAPIMYFYVQYFVTPN